MKSQKNTILYSLLYIFAIGVSTGCNKTIGHLGINKFDIMPSSPEEKSKLLEKIHINCISTQQKDDFSKTWLGLICAYGDFEDIIKVLNSNKGVLSNNRYKKIIDDALLANLYISQEKKGGNYIYNKAFANWIAKNRQIKICKMHPTEKAIYYAYEHQTEGYRRLEVVCTTDETHGDNIHSMWKTYTKALANLVSYYQDKSFKKADLKESFISLIKLAKEEQHFAQLFLEYTKVIRSIDENILIEIITNDCFPKSIILSQRLTGFFLQIGDIEHAKNFLVITDHLLNDVRNGTMSLHSFDRTEINLADFLEQRITDHNWNYGTTLLREQRYKEAEKYFIKVYNKDQNDKECIEGLFTVYSKLKNHRKAWALFEKHAHLFPHKNILNNITHNLIFPSYEEIKHFSYSEMTTIVMTALLNTNDKKQEAYYKDLVKTKIVADKQLFRKLTDDLQIRIKLMYTHDNIYDKNLQHHLLKLSIMERSDLLHCTSIMYASSANYQAALKCIEIAMEYDPSNCLLLNQKEILENILIAHTQEALGSTLITHEAAGQLPAQPTIIRNKQKSKKENKASDKNLLSYEAVLETNDPQKIHQYFQETKREISKQAVFKQGLESNHTNENEIGWLIDDEKVPIKYAEAIKLRWDSLFIAIHPDLEKSIGDDCCLQWKQILRKGFTSTKQGVSGIKYLDKKIYEAKDVSEDARLMASKMYINEVGNKLMVFDTLLTHKELQRYLATYQYTEIECPNYYE